MKPRQAVFFVALLLPRFALAGPYFKVPGPGWRPAFAAGACADPVNVGHSEQCGVFGLVTHSHNDGYWIVPGEDWTLLGVGYAASGEGAKAVIGPSANVLPIIDWLGSKAVSGWPPLSKIGKLSGSFGPMFELDPSRLFDDPAKVKGYFRLFAGAAWQF